MSTLELDEQVSGFTERDRHSKAILNTDTDALLMYRIRQNRGARAKKNEDELMSVKTELEIIKEELTEMRLLLKMQSIQNRD